MVSVWILSDKFQELFIGNKVSVIYLFEIEPNNPPIIIEILESRWTFGRKMLVQAIKKEINNAVKSFIKSVMLSLPKL